MVPSSSAMLENNVWSQIGYTYNGNQVSFYVDGQSAGSVTQNALENLDLAYVTFGKGIGAGWYSVSPYFYGQLANIQVYNTSLSSSQMLQLYRSQMTPAKSVFVPLSWLP